MHCAVKNRDKRIIHRITIYKIGSESYHEFSVVEGTGKAGA